MQADIESSGFLFSALKGAQKIRTMGAERRVYARWAAIYQRVLKYDLDQPNTLKLETEIASFIASLDTEISESNSSGISGGQRQRILIARAFATKPAIMVLDEATSALDNITQKKVLDAVYAEKRTVLMVAHRLSTVMSCDRILVMENGQIVEEGTYDELLEADGLFTRLVRKQVL